MAARSTVVELLNGSAYPLRLVSSTVEGVFGAAPPGVVQPGALVRWESESDGVFTGTEGRAEYAVGATGASIDLHWDNPYEGSNSYDEQAPAGLRLQRSGGGGDDATVLWRLDQTAGFWGQMAQPAPGVVLGPAWLLTDGRVMAKQIGSAACWALTPDSQGSYVDGTWAALQPMQGNRVWFASALLPDGSLFVSGGEYFNGGPPSYSNLSEVYDPVSDNWQPVNPPISLATSSTPATPWPRIGDASCAVLPDGRVLLGNIFTNEVALFDPATRAFTVSPNQKAASCDEESWCLMPDGTVVTVETNNPPNAEKYLPATDQWVSAGGTGVSVLAAGSEIGPALALPNGDGMTAGGSGTIVRYTPDPSGVAGPGTWSNGPTFPLDANGFPFQPKDTPACLLPDGRVLLVVNPNDQGNTAPPGASPAQVLLAYPLGLFFFLYDPTPGIVAPLQPVDATAVRTSGNAYQAAMLLLPTGQVLMTIADGDGRTFFYNPQGEPAAEWRPVIEPVPYQGRVGQQSGSTDAASTESRRAAPTAMTWPRRRTTRWLDSRSPTARSATSARTITRPWASTPETASSGRTSTCPATLAPVLCSSRSSRTASRVTRQP